MQTRTYFASSVPAALEAARRDLGPDAILVDSHLAAPAMRELGKLEVIFQVEDPVNHPRQARNSAVTPDSGLNEIRHELAALREAMGLTVAPTKTPEPSPICQ